jgi:hypothetical protein
MLRLSCRRLLLFFIACAALAEDAATPLSDTLNRRLPEWLRLSGESRVRWEGFAGSAFRHSSNDDRALTRLRLNARIRPLARLTFTVQAQDTRVAGSRLSPMPGTQQDTAELRLASVEIGDSERDGVALRFGRQEMAYGEQRLIGNNNWRNSAQTFDAARLLLRLGWARLDVISAAAVASSAGFNRRTPGNNLHGLYGALESRRRRVTVEPYLLWRLNPNFRTEAGATARFDAKYAGAHAYGKAGHAWDYDVEAVAQRGRAGADAVRAWATHARAAYTSELGAWRARWVAEYNLASGDARPRDGRQGGFLPPYPAVHDRFGLSDQIGWRNMHHLRTGVELHATPRLQLAPAIQNYWVASRSDGVYTPSGALLARVESGARSRRTGWEANLTTLWTVSAVLQVNVGYARLFPGDFLRQATPGVAYNSGFCMVSYRF